MSTQLAFDYHRPLSTRRRVCDLPAEERPLYRLSRHGTTGLSSAELLALLFGSNDGLHIAEELLAHYGSLHQLARASESQLTRTYGVGPAQAARLVATLELSRRLQEPPADERPQVTNPAAAARLLMPRMGYLEQEELWVVLLDTRNRVMKIAEIYRGSLNTSVVRIGELFRPAIDKAASAIIVAHNHPSSDPSPSPEDIQVTRQIVQAGKLLDIELLDHVIVTAYSYVSLKERGLGFD
ncbi:MAG: DNA repair protein RadC [Chloroflexi bacterium]|nr:DNA repair protein RadC [Chloroflexota bacterium]MCI0580770.1 DNA repair protein RadC [Chloroflexota bacterium]MCI0645791.1 DNA repair protein RadC [Chloroflexota bacterium]MCI0727492.1 DNA repair protein RadC [Chloroflexota bacterium]